MKRGARDAAVLMLSLGPAALARALGRRRPVVLGYHDPSPEVLDAHLAALKARYSIVTLREIADAIAEGDPARLPDHALAITLDDGARGNRALLPVLERHGVTVTIFVCTGIAGTRRRFWWSGLSSAEQHDLKQFADEERLRFLATRGFVETADAPEREALSAEEMRDLAPFVDFQSHSRLHPVLPRCSDERARDEIAGSKHDLEEALGRECYAFAYPVGGYGEREAALVAAASYRCAVTTEPGRPVPSGCDPFRVPRLFVRDDAPVRELIVRSSGVFGMVERLFPGRLWSALQVR